MIAAKEHLPRLTPEEYFTWEEKQTDKHEYINGQIYAMSGGIEQIYRNLPLN